MVKPRKKRNVLYPPWMHSFGPHGHDIPGPEQEVVLTIDEYESIRLADHENLKQEEAASRMNISRPTFTRLVDSARKKIADAMINGKIIRIKGGSYVFLKNRLRCMSCGNVWDAGKKSRSEECPTCGGHKIEDCGRKFGMGRGFGHGRGRNPHKPHM
jgi:predicted DNA-binding protein (UPF0251 family)